MQDPFFKYIEDNRQTISQHLYGFSIDPKKYDTSSYTKLPATESSAVTLESALQKRSSIRNFTQSALQLKKLAYILKRSIAQDETNSGLDGYTFPSGGGFYPIETYILACKIADIKPGLYHYSATEHALGFIREKDVLETKDINSLFGAAFESQPAGILLMTMNKNRCIKKYGSLSYVLSLIEAGHRGQNICLTATTQNIGVCPLGGGKYTEINTLLEIDGNNEHYIYAMAFGGKLVS